MYKFWRVLLAGGDSETRPTAEQTKLKKPSNGRARGSFWRTCDQWSTPRWSVDSARSATGNGSNQRGKFTPSGRQTRLNELTQYARSTGSIKNLDECREDIEQVLSMPNLKSKWETFQRLWTLILCQRIYTTCKSETYPRIRSRSQKSEV